MKFICLGYLDVGRWDALDDGEQKVMVAECISYDIELRKGGHFAGGEALQGAQTATTIRWKDGKASVTDGPFAETKDLIAGWMVIDVDTYERAIELAGELSAAPGAGGEPIHEWLEVRPFLAAPPTVTQ